MPLAASFACSSCCSSPFGLADGHDIGEMDGHWDLAVVADFDDRTGYEAYMRDPEHQRMIAETIVPIRAERAFLQYGTV